MACGARSGLKLVDIVVLRTEAEEAKWPVEPVRD